MLKIPFTFGLGVVVLTTIVLAAVIGPSLLGIDPSALSGARFQPPSLGHLMGTDDLGRDVFARVLQGARVSLEIGIESASIAVLIGTLVGSLAGFYGGITDDLLMRLTELFQIIPRFLLAIVVVALFGAGPVQIVFAVGCLSWPATARIVRERFLVLRNEDFVLAARTIGASSARIVFRHILPNVTTYIAVSVAIQTGAAILIESLMSFLGLGDPSRPSWGLLLQQAQLYLRSAWWTATFPGLALALTILALNLISDGAERGRFRVNG